MNPRVLISLTSAVAVCGCASFHSMNDQNHLPPACLATCQRLGIAPTEYVLTVSIADQSLALFENGVRAKKFPCSTSRFGIGQIAGSNCTPLGLHRIAEKIGEGEPAGGSGIGHGDVSSQVERAPLRRNRVPSVVG